MNTNKSVGQYVADDYRAASVFEKYGIDFCCKGNATLQDVCAQKELDPFLIEAELGHVMDSKIAEYIDFKDWPMDLLVDYIEKKHHRYVEQTMPVIKKYLEKLCLVHGGQHPELIEIAAQFNASCDDLKAHMRKEELVLFPFVRQLSEAHQNGTKLNHPPFGSIQHPIHMLELDHAIEGNRFQLIADRSNHYTPPPDACNTYKVAYALLQEYETDLHKHIHLENNILFQKAIYLEAQVINLN
ncbi:MAG: iron-sulfur cluster repair di-iron protein [Saprospiraceae bacterium]|nr:iron-sulfur cluster repair di-iron protein [Saprospiraceae bacterium]